MPYVDTHDGTRLFYRDWGSGNPVLFSHGWPLSGDMWEYQMVPVVERGMRAVAFDRRGFGRSDQPGGGHDYDTWADDVAVLVTSLDLRDLTLVGFSMGGGEIARYLARHGGRRVARVVLTSAALAPMDTAVAEAMIAALAADRPHFLGQGVPTVFGCSPTSVDPDGVVSPRLMKWVTTLALRASPLATIACLRQFMVADFTADLTAFTMPTLIVHGTADASAPIESARRTARAIPRSRLVEYAGAPHGLFLTERERFTRDLLAFVA